MCPLGESSRKLKYMQNYLNRVANASLSATAVYTPTLCCRPVYRAPKDMLEWGEMVI